MRSAQALRVILTVFLAVLSQCTIAAAQGVVTQTGKETIESYDSATERLTISVQYSYQWQVGPDRSFTVEPNLIGNPTFSWTGTGACTYTPKNRTIRCPRGITSFRISYRYQLQINATEDGKEEFTYLSGFHRQFSPTNAKYDLFYPFHWTFSKVFPEPNPNVNDLGHLQWSLKNKNSFIAQVRFQIADNVLHEVDGCSLWMVLRIGPFVDRQDPASSALTEGRPTAFGKEQGNVTAKNILPLPCNQHDLCYQTCGADKKACDNAFFQAMLDVCFKAFPLPCPYPNLCQQYEDEYNWCLKAASIYAAGVDEFGEGPYWDRQNQYCD